MKCMAKTKDHVYKAIIYNNNKTACDLSRVQIYKTHQMEGVDIVGKLLALTTIVELPLSLTLLVSLLNRGDIKLMS